MFKFLKDKLSKAVSRFSRSAEDDAEEIKEDISKEVKEEIKEPVEYKAISSQAEEPKEEAKVKDKEEEPEEKEKVEGTQEETEEKEQSSERTAEEVPGPEPEKTEEEPDEGPGQGLIEDEREPEDKQAINEEKERPAQEPKKGFFGKIRDRIVKKVISEDKFDEIFWDLEVALLENNVAVEVIEKVKDDLKHDLVGKPIERSRILEKVRSSLGKSIKGLFNTEKIDIVARTKEKKPYVICFVGINGSGKTTSMAKIAKMLKDNNLKIIFAAADTFRAASIEQLQQHADKLNIKMIKHDYGSDPAAVGFDAVKYAKMKDIDVVLIDTAGRLHSNTNLIDEMKKIVRIVEPDLTIFVGESITGNDCVEQVQRFSESINIDGVILSKADVDEKGGAAISVSYVTGKPIIYLGTGQGYDDLIEFDKNVILEGLGIA